MAEKVEGNVQDADMGMKPWALNIEEATVNNPDYRAVKWTSAHMQMVLMSLKPGEEIDLEVHNKTDQFIRIEQGEARVRMGKESGKLTYDKTISDDWAVLIPAGYYHHIKNTGTTDLKLYTIYAPAEHPKGITHKTYAEAKESHHDHE
ncbi:cupin domain-containing protein [Pontibacter anaerobius]|uniref:Cupin domain-containing protein n=1 Tax=Pontibacter anaerobius TaxID=2993940 RepID=A0ABT3RHH7_9BACT|nr:cupin domain-containing protein [Pontibacter anaerobius]MCX2740827.1 cupin domain-containing protein [Pontibacter anaerobius]